MSSIVELKTRPAAINEDVIARLESVLAMARSGDVIAVAIAGVAPNGDIINSWSDSDHFAALLGAITRLQFRFNANQKSEDA